MIYNNQIKDIMYHFVGDAMLTLDKDYMGALVSGLCLVHCVVGPILLFFGISAMGVSFFENEAIHLFLAVPILFFASWSIPKGYKCHRKSWPLMAAVVGVVLLLLGLAVEDMELPLTVGATCLLILAHLSNKWLLSKNQFK